MGGVKEGIKGKGGGQESPGAKGGGLARRDLETYPRPGKLFAIPLLL